MSENKATRSHNPKNYSKARAKVVQYFLKIFKRQIRASAQDKSEIKRLDVATIGPKFQTFELTVERNGEKNTRRMTIAPLGEESGSKSICFYVIYDEHLVVKIPPKPITDLDKYINSIHADQRIVFRLQPRACVVPSVSVILKRVHIFEGEDVGPETLEGKYISRLKNNPEYQEYLMVDGALVFFMDLSRYSILGDELSKIHQEKEDLLFQEIVTNKGVIIDYQNFEGRYGRARSSIGYDLKDVYTRYETGIQEIFQHDKKLAASIQYRVEEWFLMHLAGKPLEEKDKDLTPELVAEINTMISGLLEQNKDLVSSYRDMVNGHIYKQYFAVNRHKMSAIITNTMDLLAWLREKGVAMRDFKPDNLLVTGDPEKDPSFISKASKYDLGLIDVETSVIYDTHDEIKQPQLGGTPFFSTPSQLFPNKMLEETFGDIAGILYLQDWYAAVAMIYNIITGERLFENTARMLPAIIKKVQTSVAAKKKTSEFMESVNYMFWESAVSEYRTNMKNKQKLLQYITTVIPQNAGEMLLDSLRSERVGLSKIIKEQIASQDMFKSEKSIEFLSKSDSEQLAALKTKVEKGEKPEKERIIEYLNNLEKLKKRLAEQDDTIRRLNEPELKLSAYELMDIMFKIVFRRMYQDIWGEIN